MKYGHLVSMAIAAVAFLAAPSATYAAGEQNFRLTNKTGYTVSEVYVSPHNAKSWQEDVMGQDTLGDGESVNISFNRGSTACVWDLKVVYEDDDSSAEWGNFNLCTISQITIYYDEDSGKTSATWK
jgi:hypothetical protein